MLVAVAMIRLRLLQSSPSWTASVGSVQELSESKFIFVISAPKVAKQYGAVDVPGWSRSYTSWSEVIQRIPSKNSYLLKFKKIPRPAVFAGALFMMCATHILLAIFHTENVLYMACVIGGFAYGAFNSLCPTLISEIFGLKHFASIYATNSIALGVASLTIVAELSGGVYDAHKKCTKDMECTCREESCFLTTYLVCAAMSGACGFVGLYLMRKTRNRYESVYPQFFVLGGATYSMID